MLYGTSPSAAVAALVASARSSVLKQPAEARCRRFLSCQRDLHSSRWTSLERQDGLAGTGSSVPSLRSRISSRSSSTASLTARQSSNCAKGRRSLISRWSATPSANNSIALGLNRRSSSILNRDVPSISSRQASTVASSAESANPSVPFTPQNNNQTASSNSSNANTNSNKVKKPRRRYWVLSIAAAIALAGIIGWNFIPPVRRFIIAVKRCAIVAIAVGQCIIDYKVLFRKEWDDPLVRHNDYKACHKRCAERILHVLQANGGIYIKLGQHLSAVQLVPEEWSLTMRPLQDQCHPTPLDQVQALFLNDVGEPLDNLFTDFDPNPIGVASLAQVHIAVDKLTGKKVAVKLMHPDLQEFTRLDMTTTLIMLKVVKSFFPTFEFTWLGEEMEQNLPLEMDFRHEAANAKHCKANFAKLKRTSLVVPEILWSQERILVMEFIEGGRVDDLAYLSAHGIDRNAVSCEISRIFSQMLFIDGSFHGDPHAGNLLIRPVPHAARGASRSKHNFEIVLLDHGLWFDISYELRTNYARLWLAFMKPKSPEVDAERRMYAELVGNIQPDLYPIFEAAVTGRPGIAEGDFDENTGGLKGTLEGSLVGLTVQTEEEAQRLRNAFAQEGMLESVFELLRRVPRRLLMVLKINDLTRSLGKALNPSHPPWRIWLIVARFCCLSAYYDDVIHLKSPACELSGLSLLRAKFTTWVNFELWYRGLGMVEWLADRYAKYTKAKAWTVGLIQGGWREAQAREAGLL